MANVNDNSVVWQVCRYDEAQTLGGKTASEILSPIKVQQVQIFTGSVAIGSSNKGSYQTGDIPLPSGYSRTQCKYWISHQPVSFSNYGSKTIYPEGIDQSTGHINSNGGTGGSGSGQSFYILFAVK